MTVVRDFSALLLVHPFDLFSSLETHSDKAVGSVDLADHVHLSLDDVTGLKDPFPQRHVYLNFTITVQGSTHPTYILLN